MGLTGHDLFWPVVGATAGLVALIAVVTCCIAQRRKRQISLLQRHANRHAPAVELVGTDPSHILQDRQAASIHNGNAQAEQKRLSQSVSPTASVPLRHANNRSRPVPKPRPMSTLQYKCVNISKAWGSPEFGFTLGGGTPVNGSNMPSQLVVESVKAGSEAESQGMVPGDHIVNLDGQNMYGFTRADALDLLIDSADVVVQLQAAPPKPVPRPRPASTRKRTELSPVVSSEMEDAFDFNPRQPELPTLDFAAVTPMFTPARTSINVSVPIRDLESGRVFTFEADGVTTVLQAKYFIKAHLDLSVQRQLLMFHGRTLADDMVLAMESGIAEGGTITLVDTEAVESAA